MKTDPRPTVRIMSKSTWADLVRAANADATAAHREARRAKARAFGDAKQARLEVTEAV